MQEEQMDFRIAELISKYLHERITEEEIRMLDSWKEQHADNRDLWNKLTDPAYVGGRLKYWDNQERSDALWENLGRELERNEKGTKKSYTFVLRIAAALVVCVLMGTLLYKNTVKHQTNLMGTTNVGGLGDLQSQVQAEQHGVILMLGNGETVSLSAMKQQVLREMDGTAIAGSAEGLSYSAEGRTPDADVMMNKVVTPRGLTYQLMLVDGTKVWLSTASSITYPTVFMGAERHVEVSGEAYFEIAPNKMKPFYVTTAKAKIEVLGTSFNVKSYNDGSSEKTSLLSGSVKVSELKGGKEAVLRPGYEAILKEGYSLQIQKANVQDALAWKNGLFIFEDEPLGSLMLNLSRWYGIEVAFADARIRDYHFTGRLQRYDNVMELLDVIAQTSKVKFTTFYNKVTVTNVQ